MSANAATIHELRTDFRSVKRKIEEHGEVLITDHGQPSYILKSLPPPVKMRVTARNYYGRLSRRQPKALSPEKTRQFWEEERG